MFGWFWRLARNSDRILRDSFSFVFSGLVSNFTKMRWIHCWSSRPVPHPFRLGLAQCTVAGVLGVFAGWIHLGSIPAEDVDFPNGKATGESKKEKLLTFWGSANPKGSKSWLNLIVKICEDDVPQTHVMQGNQPDSWTNLHLDLKGCRALLDAAGKFHIEPEYWGPKDYRIMVNKSTVIWPIAYIIWGVLGGLWRTISSPLCINLIDSEKQNLWDLWACAV